MFSEFRGCRGTMNLYTLYGVHFPCLLPWTARTASRHRNTPYFGRLFVCLFGLFLGAANCYRHDLDRT